MNRGMHRGSGIHDGSRGGFTGRGGGRGGSGRHGGQGGRGGRGGGRRKQFDTAELRLVLLKLMESRPRHGYELIREIETRTAGVYAPSPGMIYPTLTLLEELGHTAATASDGSRRLFALTDEGRNHLAAHEAQTQAALARLDALSTDESSRNSGPVRRALQNLHTVIEQRLDGSTDKQRVFDVVDLIDEVARKIERL